MNHCACGNFLIRLTQLGARLTERRVSRMRVQVNHVRVNRLFNRTELRVTFHFTRRIGTTPFSAFHAEQVIVVARQFRGSQPLSAAAIVATILVGMMSTRSSKVFHGMLRVLPDHFTL